MKVSQEDFQWAASRVSLDPQQAEALWQALCHRAENRPQQDLATVAYYFGIATVITAMTWFMTVAWSAFGGAGIFVISILYAVCFLWAGFILWYKQNQKFLGGILTTIAVCLTPLALYGLQTWAGIWPQEIVGAAREYHLWVKSSWFVMELGTMLAAILALKLIPFPLLTVPILICLWYMAVDLTPLLLGQIDFTWEQQLLVCLWFGLACLVVAYWIELRKSRSEGDFAFWLYFFGLLSFWSGLSLMGGESEFQRFLYFLINAGLILLSLLLKRRVFLLFGGVGVFAYLCHLGFKILNNYLLFPVALTVVGVAVISMGIWFQTRHKKRKNFMLRLLPARLREIISKDAS